MKNYILLILLICCQQLSFAQPGGGGGIYVGNFYDSTLQLINVEDDSFSINLNDVSYKTLKGSQFYIPPTNHYSNDKNPTSLDISYKGKMYKIDIKNIPPENSGGYSAYMDSIVLYRPYILSDRDREDACFKNDYYSMSRPFLSNGITPYANKHLHALGYTYFSNDSIANNKKEPWEISYCQAAEKYCINCYNKSSLKYLTEAVKQNNNTYNAPILNLRLRILKYNLEKHPENSKEIIKLIQNNPNIQLIYHLEELKAKAHIYLKQYDKAMKEFEILKQTYSNDSIRLLELRYEQNKVKFYQLKYDEVIKELAPVFQNIDNNYFLNITYRGNDFEQLNKSYFLYSFSLFLQKPTKKHKENIAASIHNGINFYLDYDFIKYIMRDYYMNTTITEENFEGFKLLYQLCIKERKL